MRVIAGSARGCKLYAPNNQAVRPTSDRVKEAIFDILGGSLPQASFLDLYAGTGSIGIEALSRGASHVVFVEQNLQQIDIIKRNLARVGFDDNRVLIRRSNVLELLPVLEKEKYRFDYIFFDPPYYQGLVNETINALDKLSILAHGGIVIAEHFRKDQVLDITQSIALKDRRLYGDTVISFYGIP